MPRGGGGVCVCGIQAIGVIDVIDGDDVNYHHLEWDSSGKIIDG